MKRLTFLLSALLIALTSVFAQSAPNIAKIGDTEYETLEAAIEAAPTDGSETTITILRDVENGAGIMLRDTTSKNGSKHYNLIIDFDGHTYDVGTLVGSPKTQTQAVHLEKGQIVHLKNGRLTSSNALMMIQNYCRLTLTNMDIQGNSDCEYVVSNNCGECNILGNTSITATEGNNAFDVCVAAAYPTGVVVNVNTTGTITGKIEYGVWGNVTTSYSFLNIENGDFDNCEIVVAQDFTDNVADKIEISGGTFDCVVPAEYIENNVTLADPSITATPAELTFTSKSFIQGENIAFADTLYSDLAISNLTEALTASIKSGSESIFKAEILNNKRVRISYATAAAGNYADIIVIASGETKAEVAVSLNVTELVPSITVSPEEWSAEVVLNGGLAAAESGVFDIQSENIFEPIDIYIKSALLGAPFTWNDADKKVEFQANAADIYKDTLVIASSGVVKEIPLQVTVNPQPVINVSPESWEDEQIILQDDYAGTSKVFSITVDYAQDAAQVALINGSRFFWNNSNNSVSFSATEAGTYKDTLIITATGAETKKVALQVVVLPQPIITPDITSWETAVVFLEGNSAHAEQAINIAIENQLEELQMTFMNALSPFMWDLTDQKVVFDADAVGVYKDTIVLSSRGAETVLIPLKVEVKAKPIISVDPESWNTTVTLEGASVEANQVFDIQVANQIDAPAVSFKDGSNAAFAWNAAESKVTFSASATGTYNGTLVVTSTSAVDVEVPLQVVVNAAAPVISVDPTEWKDAIVLEGGNAAAEQAFDIQVSNSKGGLLAAIQGGENSPFAWDADNSKVSFAANAVGDYKDTLIISATDAESVKVALEISVNEPAPIYNKVTAISKDMSGKYLIVYERSATAGAAFNGTDAANNNVAVAINDNKITQYDLEDYLVTIAKMEGGYSLKSGNKYMAGKSGTGALYLEDEASLNTLAIENGELNIVSQGSYLRFNESASRFRYYSDVSYNNIKPIALYRLYEPTTTLTVSPKTAELKIGENAELSVERDGSDELVWSSADANIASVDEDGVVTAIAEGTVKIFATANNISDTCVVTVIKPVPVITADDAALAWGNLTIEQASAGQKKETAVSVTEGATLSVELDGAQKDNFLAEIKEGKLEVTFTASEAGNYAATAVLKAEGAVDVPVALSATVKAAPIIGDAKNDTIVFDVTGLSYGGDRVQYEEKSFAMPSGAEYTIQAGAGKLDAKYLQMRSNNSNSGLICTKSAGKITSVTIVFNKKTSANNIVNIYAANVPYDTIHDMYTGGAYVTQIACADGSKQTYLFEEDYEYIGIRSKSGAIYLDSIIISRDEPQIIPTTTLAISPDTAEVEVGEKVTLDIQRDGNDKLVWGTSDASIATVEKGVVTGVAAGTVKIFATANNISDTCIVIVKDASVIEHKTIAEFIAARGGKCYLTGIVSNIKRDNDGSYNKYGNFTLTDKSGSIYVYGLLTAEGEAQQFKTMGVDEHDTLTVLAQEFKVYNEVDEVVNAIFVSVSKFHQDTANVDFTEAQAIYYGENEGIHNFGLQMFSFAEWDENGESVGDGVLAELDLYTNKAHSFAGTYSTELGEEVPGGIGTEFSYIVVIEGNDTTEIGVAEAEVSITSLGEDEYRVEYSVLDEAGIMHCGVIERIEIRAYTESGSEYPIDNKQAIENTKAVFDPNSPVYNIQGMQVDRNTPGILIQKGYKFILVQ